jgi:hypothetical protein
VTADVPGPDKADFAALYELIAPDLDAWERGVRAADPTLSDAEVLDRALRQALTHVRQEAAQQTLAYLTWRAGQSRAAAVATRAASAAAREARAAARASLAPGWPRPRGDAEPPGQPGAAPPRTFHDREGCAWSVHEVAAGLVPWAKGPRCLLFGSESAIRRVWDYPAGWQALSDTELELLSWHV